MESRSDPEVHALHEVPQDDPHSGRTQSTTRPVHGGEEETSLEECPEGLCDGSGEVSTDVFDPDSGQYMRGVGTEKCLCQVEKDLPFEE